MVKGRVLNQFAMDERHGTLRIATTTGHLRTRRSTARSPC
ncbi:beta-propeller domain-containing protein [Nannocystis pusilla]